MRRELLIWLVVLASCKKGNDLSRGIYEPPAPVTGKNYSAAEITSFKQITLKAAGYGVITRMPREVSIYIVDSSFGYMNREMDSIISEINTLLSPNLVLRRVPERSAAFLQAYFTDQATYLSEQPSAAPSLEGSSHLGLAKMYYEDEGIIFGGSIFVDMARTGSDSAQQLFILHHEIMHSLGFLGHTTSTQFYTVMFYYAVTPFMTDYSDFDRKMMKLLYDPAIRSGMTEGEFDEVVKGL